MRSALILAGGTSSRLGLDKSLLEFEGRPLIWWSVERLSCVTDEVIVVARNDQQSKLLKHTVPAARLTCDCKSGFGPVAGLATGMKYSRGKYVFSTGCDLPFLNVKVIERLFELAEDYDAAVPKWSNGMIEPLHAVYKRRATCKACFTALERGEKSISMPLRNLRIRDVPVELLLPLDPELATFFNLNTEKDLELARRHWIRSDASRSGRLSKQ
ncbi:MAG: molybdenum cofactor guanylyltransferase [Methanotrichaceae archaeon]|nr:molybdenum cofactor guanylyltransferase [Methanotrichaceae archaeon]